MVRVIMLFRIPYLLRLSVRRNPWNSGRLLICLTEHVQPHNWWSRCNGVLIKRIYDLIYADGYYTTVLTTNNTFTYCYTMKSIFRRIILFNVAFPSDLHWKSRNAIKLQIRILMYNDQIFPW